jgi:uncharacterized membrane protein YfcA
MVTPWLILITVGTISGIVGGLFGIAGTLVMIPGLLMTNIFPSYKHLVGTTLFTLLPPISIAAVYEYAKRKQVNYWYGTILFITYTIAAGIGAIFTDYFSARALQKIGGGILMALGAFMLWYNKPM